jgi:hypothetical protein
MEDFFTTINKMCLPAQIYLGISTISILSLVFQNLVHGNPHKYCIGKVQCDKLPFNNFYIFAFKILYTIVVTWMLQKFCSKGYRKVAWIIALFPYFVMIVTSLLFMLAVSLSSKRQF